MLFPFKIIVLLETCVAIEIFEAFKHSLAFLYSTLRSYGFITGFILEIFLEASNVAS